MPYFSDSTRIWDLQIGCMSLVVWLISGDTLSSRGFIFSTGCSNILLFNSRCSQIWEKRDSQVCQWSFSLCLDPKWQKQGNLYLVCFESFLFKHKLFFSRNKVIYIYSVSNPSCSSINYPFLRFYSSFCQWKAQRCLSNS